MAEGHSNFMDSGILSSKLLSEGNKIHTFFGELSKDEFSKEIYSEGETWQIKDILAHLVSADINFLEYFKRLKSSGGGLPEEFDLNTFNNAQVNMMKSSKAKDLLEQFNENRNKMALWVSQLKFEDLELEGIHPAMGKAKLGEMIKMVYLHNILHLRDVKSVLSELR